LFHSSKFPMNCVNILILNVVTIKTKKNDISYKEMFN
jgi:hypothetical protein